MRSDVWEPQQLQLLDRLVVETVLCLVKVHARWRPTRRRSAYFALRSMWKSHVKVNSPKEVAVVGVAWPSTGRRDARTVARRDGASRLRERRHVQGARASATGHARRRRARRSSLRNDDTKLCAKLCPGIPGRRQKLWSRFVCRFACSQKRRTHLNYNATIATSHLRKLPKRHHRAFFRKWKQ